MTKHGCIQVAANLLANARVHTPAGTTVTVALRTDADSAVLTVSDDGPGIPDSLVREVFRRFVRGDISQSRRGSTGLGLAIVAAVVRPTGARSRGLGTGTDRVHRSVAGATLRAHT